MDSSAWMTTPGALVTLRTELMPNVAKNAKPMQRANKALANESFTSCTIFESLTEEVLGSHSFLVESWEQLSKS